MVDTEHADDRPHEGGPCDVPARTRGGPISGPTTGGVPAGHQTMEEAAVEEPIDDRDGYDFTPPPGPSKREIWKGWSEAGDVEQLLALLRSKPLGFYNVPQMLRLLMRACQVRARSDPRGFAEALFAEMAAFNGLLLLRAQLRLAGRVASCGEGSGQPGMAELPQDLTERLLPALAETQRGLAEVLAAQAATARMWALADAQRAANGDGDGTGPTATPRTRKSDAPGAGRRRRHSPDGKVVGGAIGRAVGMTDGKAGGEANGKVIGPTNGVAAGPGGRRRHG